MNAPRLLLSAAFALLIAAPSTHAAQMTFDQLFAPSLGMVSDVEKPLREELCLNGTWEFQPIPLPGNFEPGSGTAPDLTSPTPDKWEKTLIKIPSPWNVNTWGNGRNAGEGTDRPYVADSVYYPSYPDSWDGVQMGWLRRKFEVPSQWAKGRILIHFEAVAGEVQVVVNGKPAGGHFDSFLPFSLDITDLVDRNGENELLVGVRKSSLFNIVSPDYPPGQQRTYPNGSNMDNLVGIWNDVFLLNVPEVSVADVFVQPNVDTNTLAAEVTLRNDTAQPQAVNVGGAISPWVNLAGTDTLTAPVPNSRLDAPVLSVQPKQIEIPPSSTAKITLETPVNGKLKLWSPDSPNLYALVLDVTAKNGTTLDKKYTRFGWRQFKFSGRDLLLNGRKIQLWGDFVHPFGPWVCSRRYIWADFKKTKDFHGNWVRPHANIMPRAWLELADEMGMFVLDESSIFGSSINLNLKEDITWERLNRHVDGLVLRDRNHPSVMGWSPGNEMFALFFKTSPEEKKRQYEKLKELARRPFALDPTRPWVSIDGDRDLEGTMPVWSRHLGLGLPDDLPNDDKPRAIGEHGGTYFAGPPRLKEMGGDIAYRSYAARNEVLAADLYRMIVECAKPELAAFSPSELVWFGHEHLPFGYHEKTRPPNKTDGVFFPKYIEGVPGAQIERLPPYVMTLNPGFDPTLPLYKPMALFEAMKAALDPRGPQPSPWSKMPAPATPLQHPPPSQKISSVGFIGDQNGPLFESLYAMGVPLVTGPEAAKAKLLVIDGDRLSDTEAATAKSAASSVWSNEGLVWIMVSQSGSALPKIGIVPTQLAANKRHSTALVPDTGNPATEGFALSDLYFVAESGDPEIQKAGLEGSLLSSAKPLLTASNTDWSLFERSPESSKCSSMLIYENLEKPNGAALVEIPQGRGKLWVSTLNPTPKTPPFKSFWRQLWANVGVSLLPPPVTWLVPAGPDEQSIWHFTTETPAESWMKADFDASSWSTGPGGFGVEVPAGKPRTQWRSPDIYLRHEFEVKEIPRSLSLFVHHDEDIVIYLNGDEIFRDRGFLTSYKSVPLGEKALKFLRIGKNVLAVHCRQIEGGQFVDVGLSTGSTPPKSQNSEHDLLLDGPIQ